MNTGGSFMVVVTATPKTNSAFHIYDPNICEVYIPKAKIKLVVKFFDIEAMMKIADEKIYQIIHRQIDDKNCVCKDYDNNILKCLKQNKAIAYKLYTIDKNEHILHPSYMNELGNLKFFF